MKLIQRLSSDFFHSEVLDSLLAVRARHEGCFDGVWLNTLYGYPPMEAHKKAAEQCALSSEKLRAAGVSVSMQISNTIGHGQYMARRDCSGLLFEGSPVRKMVGHEGECSDYCFCWNDPYFRRYVCESTQLYAEAIQPKDVWIDDDFRANNHRPVMYGCFCEDCLAAFNEKHGTSFTRETLVAEILHGDIAVRKNWIGFVRDGIASFAEEICKAVHEVCPDAAFGLQSYAHGCYSGSGHDFIYDRMVEVTGKAPIFRPGGGAFHDHDPNRIIDKMLSMSFQVSLEPEYVKVICPEIENLSTLAMGKTMHGTAMETSLYFATGATDMSYAMLGRLAEPLAHHEKGLALFSEQRPYWEKLAAMSATTHAGGVSYAMPRESFLRTLPADGTMDDLSKEPYGGITLLARQGVPLIYETACEAFILRESVAKMMTDTELKALLKKNVVADAAAIDEMQSRGIDLGFEMYEEEVLTKMLLSELYTDHPVNDVDATFFAPSFFADGDTNFKVMTKVPSGCEVIGVYGELPQRGPLEIAPDAPNGYSSVVFTTSEGGKWAVLACGLMKDLLPAGHRARLLNLLDYISGGMPARILSRYDQALVIPRVDENGKTVGVSLLNCTIGPEEDIKLLIRNPKAEKFTFDSQYDGMFDLPYEKTEDGYIVTIPCLTAWSVGTVFVG